MHFYFINEYQINTIWMTHNICKLSIQYGLQKFKMVSKIEQIEQNERKNAV